MVTAGISFCWNNIITERGCLLPFFSLHLRKLYLCLFQPKIKSDRLFCCLDLNSSIAKFLVYPFWVKFWLFARLLGGIVLTELIFALLMLSCILWPSIFSLKMRKALLETMFIISLYDMVLRNVLILLRTSATKPAMFSVCVGSSVYFCGLKIFVTSEYLFSFIFLEASVSFCW